MAARWNVYADDQYDSTVKSRAAARDHARWLRKCGRIARVERADGPAETPRREARVRAIEAARAAAADAARAEDWPAYRVATATRRALVATL